MEKLIKKSDVIEVIKRCKDRLQGKGLTYEIMLDMVERIPSADRPQGEWIYCEDYVGHDGYECSNCGFFIPWVYDYYADSNFILNYHTCPHCDARMKEQKITEQTEREGE